MEHRESGNHEEVVITQLVKGLSGLAVDDQKRCVLAYEPIWAIGTGKTATPEQANSMHKKSGKSWNHWPVRKQQKICKSFTVEV